MNPIHERVSRANEGQHPLYLTDELVPLGEVKEEIICFPPQDSHPPESQPLSDRGRQGRCRVW